MKTLVRASDEVRLALAAEANLPVVGHAISTLLGVAAPSVSNEGISSRALQILALETLAVLITAVRNGRVFAPFVPGVSSELAKIISGDYTQGQAVFVAAITVWQRFLAIVMNDKEFAGAERSKLSKENSDCSLDFSDSDRYVVNQLVVIC